jgi:predicted enzyme related to lactoylglutathione lyase
MSTGSVIHIEIPTRNGKESVEFYEKLFGWQTIHDEALNYTMWNAKDGPGGGFTTLSESVKPGDVLIYVDSEDIEADLKKVESLGGKIVQGKSEIPDAGWFGVFKDPTGNTIALYTSMDRSG